MSNEEEEGKEDTFGPKFPGLDEQVILIYLNLIY